MSGRAVQMIFNKEGDTFAPRDRVYVLWSTGAVYKLQGDGSWKSVAFPIPAELLSTHTPEDDQ